MRSSSPRQLVRWLPALLWATVIFLLSSRQRVPQIGPDFPLKDMVGHWVLYCILGWLVARALGRADDLGLSSTFWFAIFLASAYGATDELHQRFVPHRTCDVWDWASDTAGSAAAAAAFYVYESRRSQQRNLQAS